MLFQTKLVVFGKSVYQKAFLSFENRLNVDLSSPGGGGGGYSSEFLVGVCRPGLQIPTLFQT